MRVVVVVVAMRVVVVAMGAVDMCVVTICNIDVSVAMCDATYVIMRVVVCVVV